MIQKITSRQPPQRLLRFINDQPSPALATSQLGGGCLIIHDLRVPGVLSLQLLPPLSQQMGWGNDPQAGMMAPWVGSTLVDTGSHFRFMLGYKLLK